jgi:hypothetical protein
MSAIPVYLKSDPKAARPPDPEFYWVTQSGTFLCRNHPFFQSDVPAPRMPRSLARHDAQCILQYPKLGITALETIVGFFSRVYELHGSESIVLLYWDECEHRYCIHVPQQEAGVWESRSGSRHAEDVTYEVPLDIPPHRRLVADIHCHGDIAAYASHTDKQDEIHRDGVHAVVGKIDREPPQFYADFAIDGSRFELEFGHFFKGYRKRRRLIPNAWLEKVKVKVDRPRWTSWDDGAIGYGRNGAGRGGYNRWD